jgi:hypothetical protein
MGRDERAVFNPQTRVNSQGSESGVVVFLCRFIYIVCLCCDVSFCVCIVSASRELGTRDDVPER